MSSDKPNFDEYVEDNEGIIVTLIRKMSKRGVTLTPTEAWQYMAWGHDRLLGYMLEIPGMQEIILQMNAVVATECASNMVALRTGSFLPPATRHWESPEALEAERSKVHSRHGHTKGGPMAAPTTARVGDDYAPGGYL